MFHKSFPFLISILYLFLESDCHFSFRQNKTPTLSFHASVHISLYAFCARCDSPFITCPVKTAYTVILFPIHLCIDLFLLLLMSAEFPWDVQPYSFVRLALMQPAVFASFFGTHCWHQSCSIQFISYCLCCVHADIVFLPPLISSLVVRLYFCWFDPSSSVPHTVVVPFSAPVSQHCCQNNQNPSDIVWACPVQVHATVVLRRNGVIPRPPRTNLPCVFGLS